MNEIDWHKYIIDNHFKERNCTPPPFLTADFVSFKLQPHAFPPRTKRDHKLLSIKTAIYNNITTITTEHLIGLICDASFTHF